LSRFFDEIIRRQEADRREAMLNEIFMQLLNQLDYGAPPIAQQQLDRIPDVEIDAYQVGKKRERVSGRKTPPLTIVCSQ
jgi:hypothetical protein